MQNYKEYEELMKKYRHMGDKYLDSKDYLIAGKLMSEIMENVKLEENRYAIYSEFYLFENRHNGFLLEDKNSINKLAEIATFLSAAMDENVTDSELSELCQKYRDPYGPWVKGVYKTIVENEKAGIEYKPEKEQTGKR